MGIVRAGECGHIWHRDCASMGIVQAGELCMRILDCAGIGPVLGPNLPNAGIGFDSFTLFSGMLKVIMGDRKREHRQGEADQCWSKTA